MINDTEIRDFIEGVGIDRNTELIPLNGGRNNRLFKVNDFALKIYFTHSGDTRDRLKHEYKFISFLWNNRIKKVPKPVAVNYKLNIALLDYIEGRKINKLEIGREHVKYALKFIKDINLLRENPKAQELPNAADSAFSLRGNIDHIQNRFDLLSKLNCNSEAYDFINQSLIPEWKIQKKALINKIADLKLDLNYMLNFKEKCLSPSDFGFHNALLKKDGKIIFLDFEYAGWDDPVKMICDFFCQPEIPIPIELFNDFISELETLFESRTINLKQRTKLFLPLNRLKWCCIMLNDFLRVDNKRRVFSEHNNNTQQRKVKQLKKTIEYFNKVF